MASPLNNQRGSVLIMVFVAIALLAGLTVAIQGTNTSDNTHIDNEQLILRAGKVQRYAGELERAVMFILQNGESESDIRFAHPKNHTEYGDLSADSDPDNQVFHRSGGGALFRNPPSGINDGSGWEFYGHTHVPNLGTSDPELMAVLPNVTQQFCAHINRANNQSEPLDDGSSCVHGGSTERFDDSTQYSSTPNTMNENSFRQNSTLGIAEPASQACVECSDGTYHFYQVLLAR